MHQIHKPYKKKKQRVCQELYQIFLLISQKELWSRRALVWRRVLLPAPLRPCLVRTIPSPRLQKHISAIPWQIIQMCPACSTLISQLHLKHRLEQAHEILCNLDGGPLAPFQHHTPSEPQTRAVVINSPHVCTWIPLHERKAVGRVSVETSVFLLSVRWFHGCLGSWGAIYEKT